VTALAVGGYVTTIERSARYVTAIDEDFSSFIKIPPPTNNVNCSSMGASSH